jgi:hypothetical protein
MPVQAMVQIILRRKAKLGKRRYPIRVTMCFLKENLQETVHMGITISKIALKEESKYILRQT